MDKTEIDYIFSLIEPILYGELEARDELQKKGINITRSDFYSEIPTIQEIREAKKGPKLDRVFPENIILLRFLEQLEEFAHEFEAPANNISDKNFFWENTQFSFSDALAYYCMIRLLKPNQILEIAGGYSSLIAALALKKNKKGFLKIIEPFPRDFLKEIPGVDLQIQAFQDFESEELAKSITEGDIVFIDSTHSTKYGSEVLNIYLDFLHLIPKTCYIHVHDVYLPESLPKDYMINHQIFWGEQYLLYCYLLSNNRTEVIYGSRYHVLHNPKELDKFMSGKYEAGGASFWFKQNSHDF